MNSSIREQIDELLHSSVPGSRNDSALLASLEALYAVSENQDALTFHLDRALEFPKNSLLVRALSYFAAKADPNSRGAHLALRWLLEKKTADVSTLINTATALQSFIGELESTPPIVVTSIAPFIERALSSAPSVAFSGLQVLTLIAELDLQRKVITREMWARLRSILVSLRPHAESEELDEIERLNSLKDFSSVLSLSPNEICDEFRTALPAHGFPFARDYCKSSEQKELALLKSIERQSAFWDVRFAWRSHSAKNRDANDVFPSTPVIERLFAYVRGSAGSDISDVRAVPAIAGSYLQRFMVEGSLGQKLQDSLAELVGATENGEGSSSTTTSLTTEQVHNYVALVSAAYEDQLTLEFTLIDGGKVHPIQTVSVSDLRSQRVTPKTLEEKLGVVWYLDSSDVPQADNIAQVWRIVDRIRSGDRKPELEAEFALSRRQVNYYIAAGRILGLLDSSDLPTDRAVAIAGLEDSSRMRALAVYFEDSTVCSHWMRWAMASRLNELDPESAREFLAAVYPGDPATIIRRAKTLKTWATLLAPYHYAQTGQMRLPGT